jgi:hypothetical protein
MNEPIENQPNSTLIERALNSYRKLNRNREYALSETTKHDLAAIFYAVFESRKARGLKQDDGDGIEADVSKVIEELADIEPSLLQPQPDAEPTPAHCARAAFLKSIGRSWPLHTKNSRLTPTVTLSS